MSLQAFNQLSTDEARALIRPCVDNDAWVNAVADGRPYASVEEAVAVANAAADTWTAADLDAALVHHPRIGERAAGEDTEATLSRSEQAGLGIESTTADELARGNAEYEAKFDRVFLIRAAGRSAEEILAELRRRLENSEESEAAEATVQLAQIATLRLEGILRA